MHVFICLSNHFITSALLNLAWNLLLSLVIILPHPVSIINFRFHVFMVVEVRAAVNGTIAYLKKNCFIELQARPSPDMSAGNGKGDNGAFANWWDTPVGLYSEASLRARHFCALLCC